MLAHACKPCTKEADIAGSWVQNQPALDIRSCLGFKRNKQGQGEIHNLMKMVCWFANFQEILLKLDFESQSPGQEGCLGQPTSLTAPRSTKPHTPAFHNSTNQTQSSTEHRAVPSTEQYWAQSSTEHRAVPSTECMTNQRRNSRRCLRHLRHCQGHALRRCLPRQVFFSTPSLLLQCGPRIWQCPGSNLKQASKQTNKPKTNHEPIPRISKHQGRNGAFQTASRWSECSLRALRVLRRSFW